MFHDNNIEFSFHFVFFSSFMNHFFVRSSSLFTFRILEHTMIDHDLRFSLFAIYIKILIVIWMNRYFDRFNNDLFTQNDDASTKKSITFVCFSFTMWSVTLSKFYVWIRDSNWFYIGHIKVSSFKRSWERPSPFRMTFGNKRWHLMQKSDSY